MLIYFGIFRAIVKNNDPSWNFKVPRLGPKNGLTIGYGVAGWLQTRSEEIVAPLSHGTMFPVLHRGQRLAGEPERSGH